jgi:hypothetical protein
MKTCALLTSIAVLFLATGTAFADSPLPPLEFDYDPPYETIVTRHSKLEEIRAACGREVGIIFGCAGNSAVRDETKKEYRKVCLVQMLDDEWLRAYEITYANLLRHETGHCNGWRGDHAEGRVHGDRQDARKNVPQVIPTPAE